LTVNRVEKVKRLRRRIGIAGDVIGGIVGRKELGKQHDEVDQDHDDAADQRQLVPSKAPPDQLPLRRDMYPLIAFYRTLFSNRLAHPIGDGETIKFILCHRQISLELTYNEF